MDVCPVGAITTRDYRFKSRPWDNPEAVDTICTFCEKGCNTTRVAEGQAGVGEGRAAGPHDAALQPRGQRLLDVRHRPLRLSLDRRGRSPAPGAGRARRAATLQAGRAGARRWPRSRERVDAGGGTGALRFLISAHASIEELFLLGRLGGAFGLPEDGVAISWRAREKPQPAEHEVQDPASRRAEREGRRATSASRSRRRPTARPDLAAFRQQVEQRRGEGALRLRSRARPARSATSRGSSTRASRASCRCSSSRAC